MNTAVTNMILAVVTTFPEKVGGSTPIFYAQDEKELQETAFTLQNILDGMVHEIKPGIVIVVRH